jgi:hypothetical protein
MRIEILSDAENDLIAGARFYEQQGAGLGEYFLDSIYSDIDSLLLYAGSTVSYSGFIEQSSRLPKSAVIGIEPEIGPSLHGLGQKIEKSRNRDRSPIYRKLTRGRKLLIGKTPTANNMVNY